MKDKIKTKIKDKSKWYSRYSPVFLPRPAPAKKRDEEMIRMFFRIYRATGRKVVLPPRKRRRSLCWWTRKNNSTKDKFLTKGLERRLELQRMRVSRRKQKST